MFRNILVPICPSAGSEVALEQAMDLAERLAARLFLAAVSPAQREDLTADLPGMEPNPVDEAVGDEALWPEASAAPASVPKHALVAASQCERRRLLHQIVPVHGLLLPRLRELSRLNDLIVACCPGTVEALSSRDGVALATTAACPCLFTAAKFVLLRRMAVLYDGSADCARALRCAARLASVLNLRMAVTASGPGRRLLEQRMDEARVVAVGYHVEHTVDSLLGLRARNFPAVAEEAGADIVAGPPTRQFAAAALARPSLVSLVGY